MDLKCTETMVNLVEGGFDLAIRAGNLKDSTLIARKLATFGYLLVASPAWIATHPGLEPPADLAPHWVLYGAVPNATRWRFTCGDVGLDVQVEPVRAGLGVSPLSPLLVAEDLVAGNLVRILPEWPVTGRYGIYGVTPHRAHVPARVEAVLRAPRDRLTLLQPEWDALMA